jgi:hypothetical protein
LLISGTLLVQDTKYKNHIMEGIISIINSFKTARYHRNQAKKINPIQAHRDESNYAKKQYGLAQQMFNGRMPGATAAEQNIYSNQANAMSNISRNATDGSSALAAGSAAQAQTNQALSNLGLTEADYRGNTLGNLNNQSANMQNEQAAVHADKVRRYDADLARKDAMMAAYHQWKEQGINDLNGLVQKVIQMVAGGGGGGMAGMAGMGGAGKAMTMGTASYGGGNPSAILGASGMMQGQTRVPGM